MFFTQNPIGSSATEDLQDNAISFDYAMNSPAALWQDRLGKQHKTVQQALKDVGFKPAGFDFVSGGTLGIGDRDKCVFYPTDGYWYSWNGKLPYVVPANSSPTPGGNKGWKFTNIDTGSLRTDLSGVDGGKHVGYKARTIYDRLEASPHVKDYPTLLAAIAAGTKRLVFESGVYNIDTEIVLKAHCIIHKGATIVVKSGGKITFTGQIEAGDYKIFEHQVDMLNDYKQTAPILITGCVVKASWFSDKVNIPDDIKTISDQTNNLIVAARAAFGDFVPDGGDFISTYSNGVLDFCQGFWRVDGEFSPSKQGIDGKFYKLSGGTIRGRGAGSSGLIRTLLTSSEIIFKVGRYTGALTNISGLSITAYNPDGGTPAEKYDSSAKAGVFLQGDSLLLRDFWVSGTKVASRVDSKLCYRDGVGIQFNSCIDTHLEGVFVEYCVTGIGISSSQITGTGITIFNTLRTSIGLGNFLSNWPEVQDTSSSVIFSGVLGYNLKNNAITTLEVGGYSHIDITGFFSGLNTETTEQTGTIPIRVSPGTRIHGVLRGSFRNWVGGIIVVESQASLGDEGNQFIMESFSIFGVAGIGSVIKLASDALAVAVLCNGAINNCGGGIIDGMKTNSKITLRDLSLSEFIGQIDNSVNRSLFSIIGGELNIVNVSRNKADTTLLNQYGYCASPGAVHIDSTISGANRTVNGGGVVTMSQKVVFA